jgi:dTDP-4-amino-4,6-dideoxygalactose transaminase
LSLFPNATSRGIDSSCSIGSPGARHRLACVARTVSSGWLTTGPVCAALEEQLQDYLGVRHVVAMSSCTAALETALAFLRLPPHSRVGIPTWTFASTALAAARLGLEPVLLDVDCDTLHIRPDALDRAISDGLHAVIGVHYGGHALSAEIHELCTTSGLPLIEDAAHALGASDFRGKVGAHQTAGACYSFYATKNLTSGEGGALATDDPDLAEFARVFRLHGLTKDAWARYAMGGPSGYDVLERGIKGNLSDVLASLALSQLSRFDEMQARRRAALLRYRELLADESDLRFVPRHQDSSSADHLCVVVLPRRVDREKVVSELERRGIGTSIHFRPLHQMTWFRENATLGGDFDVADELAPRILSLPLYSSLHSRDVDRVAHALAEALA